MFPGHIKVLLPIFLLLISCVPVQKSEKEPFNIEWCSSLNLSLREQCNERIGEIDVAFCESLQNVSQADYCYILLRDKNKDSSFCDNVLDASIRDRCYVSYPKSIDTCKKIQTLTQMDECYTSLALTVKDPTICANMNDWRRKDICYLEMASDIQDSMLCSKISTIVQSCADSPDKGRTCTNFSSTDAQVICIAAAQKDETICDTYEFFDSTKRYDCYTYVGWARGDWRSLCPKIKGGMGEFYCMRWK